MSKINECFSCRVFGFLVLASASGYCFYQSNRFLKRDRILGRIIGSGVGALAVYRALN